MYIFLLTKSQAKTCWKEFSKSLGRLLSSNIWLIVSDLAYQNYRTASALVNIFCFLWKFVQYERTCTSETYWYVKCKMYVCIYIYIHSFEFLQIFQIILFCFVYFIVFLRCFSISLELLTLNFRRCFVKIAVLKDLLGPATLLGFVASVFQ